jgi:predicted alpha/beta superfamily hydrolase
VWWIGTGLQQTIQNDAQGRGKIYLDIGGKEGEVIVSFVQHLTTNLDTGHQVYLQGVRQVQAGLLDKGYRLYESLLYVEDAEAIHHESAWAKRLPDALRFLIPH